MSNEIWQEWYNKSINSTDERIKFAANELVKLKISLTNGEITNDEFFDIATDLGVNTLGVLQNIPGIDGRPECNKFFILYISEAMGWDLTDPFGEGDLPKKVGEYKVSRLKITGGVPGGNQ